MSRMMNGRKWKIGLIAAVVAGISGWALKSRALPANEVDTVYYSDRNFGIEVGETTLLCNGGFAREGRTGPYAIRTSSPCHGVGPIVVFCSHNGAAVDCPDELCSQPDISCL